MIGRRLDLAVALLLPLAACVDREDVWTGTMYDSAGVTIVSNTALGIWRPGEEWTVEEELRIGTVDGSPEYLFGDIRGITVDSRGQIYVLDGLAQHINVYSPDGVFQQTVGGSGEGPGELRGAVALLMGPGDTLLVQDNRAFRMNRYASDGAGAGGYVMAVDERRPEAFKATESGVIAEQFQFPGSPGRPGVETSTGTIALVTTDGAVLDTLITYGSVAAPGVHYYAPVVAWDITESLKLVFGVSGDYRIRIYSDRRLERIIAKPFQRQSITAEEKETFLDRLDRGAREAGVRPEVWARMRANTHIADFYPAFYSIEVGLAGTIWVQRVRRVSDFSEEEFGLDTTLGAPKWDVFDSEGRLLGVVRMPQQFLPMVFRGDRIYGVCFDEFDVGYVLRLRIDGAPGAGVA